VKFSSSDVFRSSRLFLVCASFAALILGTSCAHYQLGTEGKLTFSRLYIEPIENRAAVPQATALVTTQIREAFIRDGRVSVVSSPSDADATIKVSLTHYGRVVTTVLPGDTGLARKFDIHLEAQCTLRDGSGNALFDKRAIQVTRQIFTTATPPPSTQTRIDSNQLQAEYEVLPLLATDLANKVTHAALDVW